MGQVVAVWKNTIPGILTCQGAIPQNEEVASLTTASTFGDVCAVHVTRQSAGMCLKRTFGLVYFEGNYRGFPKPFWEGEPAGPGADSFDRQDDPAVLVARASLSAITGQADVRFQGAAVRALAPLESEWGFREIPALLAQHLPEDIAGWDHGNDHRGGIEYWWKDRDFRTVQFVDWDPSPPRAVATWTRYTGTGSQSGTGTPTPGTGLLVGTFAA